MNIQCQTGFSLIELMIVVAIVAILAAIGYPSYSDYVSKTRRSTDGTMFLMGVAQSMEQFASQNGNTYATSMGALNYAASTSPDGYYTISIDTTDPTGYLLTATPTSLGDQDEDVCGTLSINADMVKTATLAGGNCWPQ